jgi:hypothetical protein
VAGGVDDTHFRDIAAHGVPVPLGDAIVQREPVWLVDKFAESSDPGSDLETGQFADLQVTPTATAARVDLPRGDRRRPDATDSASSESTSAQVPARIGIPGRGDSNP